MKSFEDKMGETLLNMSMQNQMKEQKDKQVIQSQQSEITDLKS